MNLTTLESALLAMAGGLMLVTMTALLTGSNWIGGMALAGALTMGSLRVWVEVRPHAEKVVSPGGVAPAAPGGGRGPAPTDVPIARGSRGWVVGPGFEESPGTEVGTGAA